MERRRSQGVPADFCQAAAPSLRFSGQIDIAGLIGTTDEYLCLHPGNSMLTHELVGKLSLGINPDEQPRWG